MKKTILIFFVVVLAFSASAQVSGGLKAGLNIANQNFDAEGFSLSPDSKMGFHVGAYLNLSLGESFGLQPELLFNSVGWKIEEGNEKYTESWNYLSVPVMLRYNISESFNIHAGPQFGFLLGATGKYEGDGVSESEDIESTQSLDLGLGFGLGVDLPMGLNFSARYVLGLSNVYDVESEDFKVTNNVIQISIGYKLFGGN